MFKVTAKKALIFSVPIAILAAAFFVLPKVPGLAPAHRELLLISPYLAAVTGMFLSVHFHRGRPFTALLLVSILYFICRSHLGEGVSGFAHQELYLGLSLLLPFNFALLALMREPLAARRDDDLSDVGA